MEVIASQVLHSQQVVLDHGDIYCLTFGLTAGFLTVCALVLWLKRGAPASLGKAGLYTGVAGARPAYSPSRCIARTPT